MKNKNYKARYEELQNLFHMIMADHWQALESLGDLRAENEILKGLMQKHGIEIPVRYVDF